MGHQLASLLLVAVLAGLVGACGGKTVPVPQGPPPRAVEPSTLADPPAEEDQVPLVAPPPAYGNKVVLARATSAQVGL